jgi:hypothetical protein
MMLERRNFLARILLSGAAAFVGSCGGGSSPSPAPDSVRVALVQIQLPGDLALPPGTQVSIRVVEVSGPDRAIIGSLTAPPGQTEYRVECKAARIRESESYGLEVAAVADGRAIAMNRSPYSSSPKAMATTRQSS